MGAWIIARWRGPGRQTLEQRALDLWRPSCYPILAFGILHEAKMQARTFEPAMCTTLATAMGAGLVLELVPGGVQRALARRPEKAGKVEG